MMSRMKGILYILITSFLLGFFCQESWARKKKRVERGETLTPYRQLFQGKKVQTSRGVMTIHKVGDKVLVEYPLNLLGKEMLLVSSIEDISDNGEGVVGQFGGTRFPSVSFFWTRRYRRGFLSWISP